MERSNSFVKPEVKSVGLFMRWQDKFMILHTVLSNSGQSEKSVIKDQEERQQAQRRVKCVRACISSVFAHKLQYVHDLQFVFTL